ITGGLVRTAATGNRWELSSAQTNRLLGHSAVAGSTAGGLEIGTDPLLDDRPRVNLWSPALAGEHSAGISLTGGIQSVARINADRFETNTPFRLAGELYTTSYVFEEKLPDPINLSGASTNEITNTSWLALPYNVTITLDTGDSYEMWVEIVASGALVAPGGADGRLSAA